MTHNSLVLLILLIFSLHPSISPPTAPPSSQPSVSLFQPSSQPVWEALCSSVPPSVSLRLSRSSQTAAHHGQRKRSSFPFPPPPLQFTLALLPSVTHSLYLPLCVSPSLFHSYPPHPLDLGGTKESGEEGVEEDKLSATRSQSAAPLP